MKSNFFWGEGVNFPYNGERKHSTVGNDKGLEEVSSCFLTRKIDKVIDVSRASEQIIIMTLLIKNIIAAKIISLFYYIF